MIPAVEKSTCALIVTAGNIVLQKSAVEKQACVLIMAAGKNSFRCLCYGRYLAGYVICYPEG